MLTAAGTIVGLYFLLAYIVLPLFWRHYEHQHGLEAELDELLDKLVPGSAD